MGNADNSQTWFIVQTNPNCERKAAAEMRRAGLRVYLPTMAREKRHPRTKKLDVGRRPALVGYLFIRHPVGAVNWYALRQCQGVKGVICSGGAPYRVKRDLIVSMMRAQRALYFDTPGARAYRMRRRDGVKADIRQALVGQRFRAGMVVRAVDGPWQNIKARIERITKNGTIEAVATIMGKETTIPFSDPDDIEVVEQAA